MAKKKNNFFYALTNLFLIFICFAVLYFAYTRIINIDDIYKNRYPTKYEEFVLKYAEKYDTDKYLVYAIIRTESYFDPDAVSKKGAVGLMQIMPETGKWAAEKLKIENFSEEDLLDAEKNIMIGVWYFKYLTDKFDGDMRLAVSAYNAGPTNVNRWLGDEEHSTDGVTLTNIPFEETKNYERKIMNAYDMYKRIYED